MTIQPDLFASARAARDAGMARALAHAEAEQPNWGDVAYMALVVFVALHPAPRTFTSLEFREWARSRISDPPTPKAFGPVFVRAARAGIIRKVGYAPHPERHASPTVLWEAVT
jgi:hypothetical protein